MGFRNIIRMISDAMAAGEKWDTNGETLKIIPEVDNSGTIQVGDGTNDIDVKVFMGSTGGYIHADVSENTLKLVTDLDIRFANGSSMLADVSANTLYVPGDFYSMRKKTRTIISSGTTTLTTADFGKFIISATNNKHLTLPNPVGNTGAEMEFLQVITRNTVLQSVNATGAKFAWNGDNAVHTIRINSAGDWIRVISSGVDWYVGSLGADVTNVVPNIAASF